MSRSMAEQRRQNVDSGEIAHIGPSGETPEAVDSAPVSGRSAAASGVDDTGHAGHPRELRSANPPKIVERNRTDADQSGAENRAEGSPARRQNVDSETADPPSSEGDDPPIWHDGAGDFESPATRFAITAAGRRALEARV